MIKQRFTEKQGFCSVVLSVGYLVKESVQHAHAEDLPCSEGQAEHKHQVGAFLSFLLHKYTDHVVQET